MIKLRKSDGTEKGTSDSRNIEKNITNSNAIVKNNLEKKVVQPNEKLITNITNDTFFQKFDKSKKDHNKNIKKLKLEKRGKEINSGTMTVLDKKLQENKFVIRLYSSFAIVSAFIIILGVVLFTLLIDFYHGTPAILPKDIIIAKPFYEFIRDCQYQNQINIYKPLVQTLIIISMMAVVFVFLPIIFMIATWFVGISNIHQDKKYAIFYMTTLAISLFLLFFAMILLFAIGWGPKLPFVYPSNPAQ
ncbi:MAG: hypothetical protein ACRDCG_02855 [Mycoplasmoidaceae bacterium]